jgi:hypothetical protein
VSGFSFGTKEMKMNKFKRYDRYEYNEKYIEEFMKHKAFGDSVELSMISGREITEIEIIEIINLRIELEKTGDEQIIEKINKSIEILKDEDMTDGRGFAKQDRIEDAEKNGVLMLPSFFHISRKSSGKRDNQLAFALICFLGMRVLVGKSSKYKINIDTIPLQVSFVYNKEITKSKLKNALNILEKNKAIKIKGEIISLQKIEHQGLLIEKIKRG